MKLSIVTINYNDAAGLRKTLASVATQTYRNIEHVIVDAASTDGSVEVIKEYAEAATYPVIWVSEPDRGIYNGMNKGIRKSTGDYCQFLNSGDFLAAPNVTERMMASMEDGIDILYGDMLKLMPNGEQVYDISGGGKDVTLNTFYGGCLNHGPAYIKRSLFDEYGYYDETLMICSDWKFYMQSIVLGKATAKHVDIVVTHFDMNGISEKRKDILKEERNRLLNEMIPQGILKDYDRYHFAMSQYDRLKRHHIWGLVWFIERVLFKLEKWGILK